jgi:hypothetical protein
VPPIRFLILLAVQPNHEAFAAPQLDVVTADQTLRLLSRLGETRARPRIDARRERIGTKEVTGVESPPSLSRIDSTKEGLSI